jgi:hypothetical protein
MFSVSFLAACQSIEGANASTDLDCTCCGAQMLSAPIAL